MTYSVLLLSRYTRLGPSSRVRQYNFVPALEDAGFQVTQAPLLSDDYLASYFAGRKPSLNIVLQAYRRRFQQLARARRYDLIWLEKEALPWLPSACARSFLGEMPVIVDFDDPWYLRYAGHGNVLARMFLSRKFESLLARATVVTTANPALTKWATSLHAPRVVEIPPVVDLTRYPLLPLPDGPFTIGWIGTPSNVNYLMEIAEPLRHMHAQYGSRLRVIGGPPGFSLPGIAVDNIPWSEETEAHELARCHVGVMPLTDGPWERAKSAYKIIQYMAAGRPALASPVGANLATVIPGKVGFLPRDPNEWVSALSALAEDNGRVRELGAAARERVEAHYSIERAAPVLIDVFREAVAGAAKARNVDTATVSGFGREWSVFRQSGSELSDADRAAIFSSYFAIFPWTALPHDAVGMDVGSGSGRWAVLVAPRVGQLHLVDPSEQAMAVARTNLAGVKNASFHVASVAELPMPDASLDFAYSLGVLHHVPDTQHAINCIASKLKPGAPFLIYLYYALDNRPGWYRTVWRISNVFRNVLSRSPNVFRYAVSQCIAALAYWPLARIAAALERFGALPESFPLSFYRNRSFYVMRTDAYDRFCTPLEKRFTRQEIRQLLEAAGFERVAFSEAMPFWCAVGFRSAGR